MKLAEGLAQTIYKIELPMLADANRSPKFSLFLAAQI